MMLLCPLFQPKETTMPAKKPKPEPKEEWLPTPRPVKKVNEKHLKIVTDWIESKEFDFKIHSVEYENVFDNRWRINVCTMMSTGQAFIVEQLSRFHGKSYFVTVDENGNVIDRTTGRITEAQRATIIKTGNKGKYKR
jgi:hypothetical protein|tara:strand:+ start:470 stop:880 length:411 start_codon:yes stop_codon:yes gene_type:complete